MELVLNDMRMSFFGANPTYAATFRPKDFSGDGLVFCSAYGWAGFMPSKANTSHAKYAAATSFYGACDAGDGPALMLQTGGTPANPGTVAIATTRWDTNGDKVIDARDGPQSVTGYFTQPKSHYYRMMVRGEVWDQVRKVAVAQANLETSYAVDPGGLGPLVTSTAPPGAPGVSGTAWSRRTATGNGPSPSSTSSTTFDNQNQARSPAPASGGLENSAILFQKWHRNRYQMNRIKTYP